MTRLTWFILQFLQTAQGIIIILLLKYRKFIYFIFSKIDFDQIILKILKEGEEAKSWSEKSKALSLENDIPSCAGRWGINHDMTNQLPTSCTCMTREGRTLLCRRLKREEKLEAEKMGGRAHECVLIVPRCELDKGFLPTDTNVLKALTNIQHYNVWCEPY